MYENTSGHGAYGKFRGLCRYASHACSVDESGCAWHGSDCQFYLFGLIPVTHSLNSQAALDRAKAMANADVLTDVTVDFVGGYYILFSNNCVRVHGKGVARTIAAQP